MYVLIAGAALFFLTHLYSSFRTRMPGRDIRVRIGYAKFMGLYSLVTGLGFVLMLWGYGLARPSPIVFNPPEWGRHATLALMLPALILLMAAYGPRGYIKQAVKHPMLLAVILWSGGHLLANGELNSLILFGGFLAYALIDMLAVMSRTIPIKKASISGDLYAVIIGTVLYFLLVKYLHEMMFGMPIT